MSKRFIVIGGGFYGTCIALYLRSISSHVVLLEREPNLFTQASFANQARVHAGFHYPRSFATAKRSIILRHRYLNDFGRTVRGDFQMLYAIARYGSKTSAARFFSMFQQLDAPIRPATVTQTAMFDPDLVEAVFQCDEFAFDALRLRDTLSEKLNDAGVEVRTGVEAKSVESINGITRVTLTNGAVEDADLVFNATYARLNHVILPGDEERLPIKNELTEIALVEPPTELDGLGVTVMDGPFFSIMPFPAASCYSLTHVRYTPQRSWRYGAGPIADAPETLNPRSRWMHMVRDAARFMPCVSTIDSGRSLFVIKAVLEKNEIDDGRPIFVHRHDHVPGLFSVLGGKIDNIYDLFSVMPSLSPDLRDSHPDWVFGRRSAA